MQYFILRKPSPGKRPIQTSRVVDDRLTLGRDLGLDDSLWLIEIESFWGCYPAALGSAYSEHTIRFPAYLTSTTVLVRSLAPICLSAALKSSRWRRGVTLGTIMITPGCNGSCPWRVRKSERLFVTNV